MGSSNQIRRITKKRLREITSDYHRYLPTWENTGELLYRQRDIVRQSVYFEPLSYNDYRPWCYIHIVLSSESHFKVYYKMLDGEFRRVREDRHKSLYEKVFDSMRGQFYPPIDGPMDLLSIASLCESFVERGNLDKLYYLTGLALLNARNGNIQKASSWCNSAKYAVNSRQNPLYRWEEHALLITEKLLESIKSEELDLFWRTHISATKELTYNSW